MSYITMLIYLYLGGYVVIVIRLTVGKTTKKQQNCFPWNFGADLVKQADPGIPLSPPQCSINRF